MKTNMKHIINQVVETQIIGWYPRHIYDGSEMLIV